MDFARDELFQHHPDPMWIYDIETLRFLEINESAIAKYGYSKEEFLAMSIADIRPPEDMASFSEALAALNDGRNEGGLWRHILKSGQVIYVDISSYALSFADRAARLVTARDVSRLVIAEEATKTALARETIARKTSDALAVQFQSMFATIPGMFIVFSPDSLDVIAASDDYLQAIGAKRSDVLGQALFHIMPELPDDVSYTQLRSSCDRVIANGTVDQLDVFPVLIPLSDPTQGSRIQYWLACTSPVAGPDGKLLYLLLRLQDVTAATHAAENKADVRKLAIQQDSAGVDLLAHSAELKADNLRLLAEASQLKKTQSLLDTGIWRYFVDQDRLEWSGNLNALYGVSEQISDNRFEDFIALLHPDDRDGMRQSLSAFMESGERILSFSHRVIRPDNKIVYLEGVAERQQTDQGTLLNGVVQNVTKSIEAERDLARAKRMLEIAGHSARFGTWYYSIADARVYWSDETARIHDEPPGFSPDLGGEITYFMPEYRARIEQAYQACIEKGEGFSDVFQITSAKGRLLWIRASGAPEYNETGQIIGVQGACQDITELKTEKSRAENSERLLEIAGRAAKLGGWRISLDDKRVSWSHEIATMLELPPGTRPTYEHGFTYFAPEEQAAARKVFETCVADGKPFDDIRDFITAKGNRIKVRSVGIPVRDQNGRIIAIQGAMQDITELSNAQMAADEVTTRLADTLENMGEAFFTFDRDRRFTYVNSWGEALLGKDRAELLQACRFDDFPAVFGALNGSKLVHALETGTTLQFDNVDEHTRKAVNVTVHPTFEGLAVYVKDITAARDRDRQLLLMGTAVERIGDVVIITEAQTGDKAAESKIIYVNKAFERLTGYTCKEAIGQTPSILHGPKTQQEELKRIRKAITTFRPVSTELINYTKDGTAFWVELAIMPITDQEGECTHLVWIQRDITARRRAEETLRFSDERFRLLSKATKTAIWDWDVIEGRCWWSDEMEVIFGHRPEPGGVIPTVWRTNIHPDDAERVLGLVQKMLLGETDSFNDRYRFAKGDGTWTTVEDQGFMIRDETGKPIRALGSMMDISEALLMEERIFHSQKMEVVGQLTGGVAHDFNNLLTVIMGNGEILQDQLEDGDSLRRYVDMIAAAAERAAELTGRLLAFSRKQALQPQVLDVNAAIASLEGMLRRILGEHIDIEIVRAGGLWKAEIDLGQLETALLNLVTNARDAMPDGGALTIETANTHLDDDYVAAEPGLTSGQYVVISVSDTGHGISKAMLGRVFEPFFTTKGVGRGTGLGLSMVYGFVKQTGGHIRVYSETDTGTTFKLYFPRYNGQSATQLQTSSNLQVRGGHETILVVEDDELIKEQLAFQLRGLGYVVFSATEGKTALATLRDHPEIDLLLTDVVLPGGMNGRQIADAACEQRPELKVLYTSGYSENAIVHHGRLDPGVELLVKPYRRATLAAKVRKVLDH